MFNKILDMFLEELFLYKSEISMIVQLNEKKKYLSGFDMAFVTFFFSFHGVK